MIPFDECFTSTVGSATSDINSRSICGQYLIANSSLNIQQLLDASALKAKGKSKLCAQIRASSLAGGMPVW